MLSEAQESENMWAVDGTDTEVLLAAALQHLMQAVCRHLH